ncbi:hypothetical protein CSUB01_08489 [Colletotrichum sublineola]|uniref:Heterokaryon incompatibility domain-containing protein n=1 Tax=Colletotrichum sublineola TaxID=1173701 RepID=A0A066XA97_COLSU|nr:hypothetical protein CSUB01_08489 [Colletotrichum sublineola]
MDRVYKGRPLIVWLGEPSENSHLALELMRDIRACYHVEGTGKAKITPEADKAATELVNSRSKASWKAFLDLIRRPWFTRRWVVQEFVLSAHKHAYLGDQEICFEYIAILCDGLRKTPLYLDKQDPQAEIWTETTIKQPHGLSHLFPAPVLDPLENLMRLSNVCKAAYEGETDSLRLERLLDSFASFDSYDPRDGIYSFLSLASDIKREEWVPDYSENNTVTDLYGQAVLHIMRSTGSLDIICRRVHSHTEVHPSRWIPWFGPQQVKIGTDGFCSIPIHGYNTKSLTTFGQPLAALRLDHPNYAPKICKACKVPHGSGRSCDGCIGASDVNHDPTHRFGIHNNGVYFASGRSFVKSSPSLKFEACKVSGLGRYVPLKAQGFLVDTVKSVGDAGCTIRGRGFMHLSLPLDDWLNLPGARGMCLDEDGRPRDTFVRALTGNRRFAITERSLGFVPDGTAPGDRIAIIAGCSVPIVLRNNKNGMGGNVRFLVGECYIQGLMEGEYMDSEKAIRMTLIKPSEYVHKVSRREGQASKQAQFTSPGSFESQQ